ncbi:hypothetical protein IMX07_10195 [bacterium]|nr:hypothetical protein [bacterium]
MNEQEVVEHLATWLQNNGWNVVRANHRGPGFDIEARQGLNRWFIEAKGDYHGDEPNNRMNFNQALGFVLNNRQYPDAKYSVAFPDIPFYRRLWQRSPQAGRFPVNSCLLVSNGAAVDELF